MEVLIRPLRPSEQGPHFTVWANGAVYGWCDAVTLGQPSVGPNDVASPEIVIPIRWKLTAGGRLSARGFARQFWNYVPKRGRERPPPEMLSSMWYLTTRDSLISNGWVQVNSDVSPEEAPKHSGFISHDLGWWAIADRRLA